MRRVLWLAIGLGIACGGDEPPPTLDQAALDHWTSGEEYTPPVSGNQPSRTLGQGRQPRSNRNASGTAVAEDGSFAFRQAPLTDALRFLAERAGLQLVADSLSGVVNQELRDVSPREALEILAWQNHVELQFQGRTVIARQQ